MNPNKALWEKGDFTKIAAFMRQSGEAIVKSLGITTPMRALDLGCGDGFVARELFEGLSVPVVAVDSNFTASDLVPYACWNRVFRQAFLNRNVPGSEGGYIGVRSAVRV